MTVSWLAMLARNTPALVVLRFLVCFPAMHIFILKWFIACSIEVFIFIERILFVRIALDTWKHAELYILVDVSSSPLLCGAAGFFTITDLFFLSYVLWDSTI